MNASTSFVIPVTPTEAAIPSVTNTASVTGGGDPTCPVNGRCTSTTITPVDFTAALTVLKTAGAPSGNTAGSTISYSFLVTNTGNVTLTAVSVTDPLLGGTVTCASTTLAPGANTTCGPVSYTLTQADVDAGVVNNSATAGGTPPVGAPVTSPPSTTSTPITQSPAISLVKTANVGSLPAVGQLVGYTFTATNTGNVTLTAVSISDPLPGLSVLSCAPVQPATLAPNQQLVCSATYTVTTADLNAGGVTNTATATGTPPAGGPVSDTDSVTLTAPPVLTVSKALTGESITVDGFAQPGEVLTYTITLSNQSGTAATGVAVNEVVPANTVFVGGTPAWSCAAGSPAGTACNASVNVPGFSGGNPGTATLTFSVQVANPLAEGVQSVANAVAINGQTPPNCAVTPGDPACVVSPTLNLRFDKTVLSLDTVGPNAFNVRYQLVVRNVGATAANYTLVDTLGFSTAGISFNGNAQVTTVDGSINPGLSGGSFVPVNGVGVQLSAPSVAIAAGTTHTYVLRVPIAVSPASLGNATCTGAAGNGLFNAAAISGSMSLGSQACQPIGQLGVAAIRLEKTVQLAVDFNNNGWGDVGDVLNYAFTISNTGDQPLSVLHLYDPLVSDLACDPVSLGGQPLSVLFNDQVFFGTFEMLGSAPLPPGDSIQCWATHTLTADDVARRRVTNVATASGRGSVGEVVSSTSTAIYSAFP